MPARISITIPETRLCDAHIFYIVQEAGSFLLRVWQGHHQLVGIDVHAIDVQSPERMPDPPMETCLYGAPERPRAHLESLRAILVHSCQHEVVGAPRRA